MATDELNWRNKYYYISYQDFPENQTTKVPEGIYKANFNHTRLRWKQCLLKAAEPGEPVGSQKKKLEILEAGKAQQYNIYPRLKA